MGVLLPADGYDYKGQTPKRLATRMVRAWREKHIDGERVWLHRSRYVAREFAWLSPDRQDLFSPASSVITTRLLPTLFQARGMGHRCGMTPLAVSCVMS